MPEKNKRNAYLDSFFINVTIFSLQTRNNRKGGPGGLLPIDLPDTSRKDPTQTCASVFQYLRSRRSRRNAILTRRRHHFRRDAREGTRGMLRWRKWARQQSKTCFGGV